MFIRRQTALLSALTVLLLLTTAGQSATVTDLPTTAAPAPLSSLSTQLDNCSSMEEPCVLAVHRSCGSEHENFCENGGQCMYPQDNEKPFCICTSSYSGPRCMFFNDHSRTLPELEQLIGITFGAFMLFFFLAIIFYCFAYKRCIKSAPLIKSAPSESSV